MPGARLGSYEIVAALGAGGMGEVYRARDTRLNRDVALKFLPDAFTADAERVARFQREAQLLAALNHPNIGGIYGLEQTDASRFLVLELIDGGTLATRIASGPLPIDDALAIARQIAEALEAAHEKGIIHRDLKPANVGLTRDGQVKVLDFGLAKTFDNSGSVRLQPDLSQSPTITTPAMMTGVGVILGTAAYMAPEQAKGRAADKRCDVWAFGCVLYEMLTGKRAFQGEDVGDTLAAVLRGEPDWTALPKNLPPRIRTLLTRCLAKDRKQRLADISVALFLLTESEPATPRTGSAERRARIVAIASACGAAVAVAFALWLVVRPANAPRSIVRLQAAPPSGAAYFVNPFDNDIAVSPGGSRVAFIAKPSAATTGQLFMRELDRLDAAPLAGTEGARGPFFSPDGQWIGYSQNNDLKKMSIHGGPPVVLCRGCSGGFRGATWGPDDTIIFSSSGGSDGLRRIGAAGGDPVVVATPDRAVGASYTFPEWLPGGRVVLFTAMTGSADTAQVVVRDVQTGDQKVLVRGGSHARYAAGGHLVYASDGALRTMAFDPKRLVVAGNPVPVLDHVVTKSSGAADFSLSTDGSLVYLSGDARTGGLTLVWLDRQGREEAIPVPARSYILPRLSPDGQRIALDIRDQENDIWVWDFNRKTLTRLTFDPALDQNPIWTPDGRRVIFGSSRTGVLNVFWKTADGTGGEERLTNAPMAPLRPSGISPDGKWLVAQANDPKNGTDIVLVSIEGDHAVKPLIRTPFNELNGEISPDGRWIAYQSNESGRDEVYVRPFPNVDVGRWQVSTNGGTRPLWGRNGRELFYIVDLGGRLMSVPVHIGERFEAGNPSLVFSNPLFMGAPQRNYDVSADGRRILAVRDATAQNDDKSPPPQLNVVLNWTDELKTKIK